MTEATAVLTPLDTLRQRLNEAPAPLLLKDAIKGLTQKGKKAPPPPDFGALLSEEEQAGRVFRYASGAKGADRYWGRDEKLVIREAVLNAATEPKKIADLQKIAKEAVKADKLFANSVVDEMIPTEQLHKQSNAAKPLYGKEKALSLDKGSVSAALLAAADPPQNSANLVKAAKQATGADKAFAESILKELIDGKQLHPQSAAAKPLYGKEPLPERNVREPVVAALLTAAEPPDTETKLVAVAQKATGADKSFVESVFKELIDGKQLYKQSPAKKQLYGKNEPPHPLDVDPGRKAFIALVKAGQKLVEVTHAVTLDEVFQRLRIALEHKPPTPHVEQTPVPVPPAPISPPPLPKPEPLTPEHIRSVLKTAYDELCLDIEFQDKLVEVRRLYHEAERNLPGLTIEQFHRELKHLQQSRTLELQALNEVQRAKEPELAIRDGDRLLYYAIWR